MEYTIPLLLLHYELTTLLYIWYLANSLNILFPSVAHGQGPKIDAWSHPRAALTHSRAPHLMQTAMELWSTAFLSEEGDAAAAATASVDIYEWRRITEEHGESGRIFGEIQCAAAAATAQPLFIALGTPVQTPREFSETEGGAPRLYLPPSALEALGCNGCGELAEVTWRSQEAFPHATRIVLRPHDSAFYFSDAKEELERALTRAGIVQCGSTLTIPLECLGGFPVMFDVVATEPANLVLAEGDEVALEFEEALDAAAAAAMPTESAAPAPEPSFDSMLSTMTAAPAPPLGTALGGQTRLMPDGTRWNPWKHGAWSGS